MSLEEQNRSASLGAVLALCGLSGVLLSLSFPPAGMWFVAWIALVPWLVALRVGRGWSAVVGSWFGGFLFFLCLLYWLVLFGMLVWVLAAAVLGVWLMVWGMLARWSGRLGPMLRVVAVAVLWCGIEWGRGLGPFGFTWGWLGYSQSPALALMPVARVVGTVGLSFLMVAVNAVVAEAGVGLARGESRLRWGVRAVGVCGVVALVVVGAGGLAEREEGPGGPVVRVAVIQGSAHGPLRAEQVNVPLTREEQVRTLDIYQSLTAEAGEEDPLLVVWPESVLPGVPASEPWISERVAEAARESGAWVLTGGPYRDEDGLPRNSAYLYAPTGHERARYDKVKLVPFGEYVPGRGWLPLLSRYHVREEDFTAGVQHRALQAGVVTLGPMICFESIFPGISWELVGQRAQVLVIITNDAWFGRTAAAAQHRQIAVLRAVESNRWVVRGASTGISSIIAPDGEIIEEAGLFDRKWISAEVRLARGRSVGGGEDVRVGWGPAFSWAALYLSLGLAVIGLGSLAVRGGGADRPRVGRRRRGRGALQ